MTVSQIIGEALTTHGLMPGRRSERIGELLERVGLRADLQRRFRTSFPAASASASARSRVGCWSPISSSPMDVRTRCLRAGAGAQSHRAIQRDLGLTLLFITHDLAVVDSSATRWW